MRVPDAALAGLARAAPGLVMALMALPVLAGLAGTVLPAMGYLPAAGLDHPSLDAVRGLLATPGLGRAVLLSAGTGLGATALALALAGLALAALLGRGSLGVVRALLVPLLAVPHAAMAFGLAALVQPSGIVARLLSPWATGWHVPPDLLVVGDVNGIALTLGLAVKEAPFLLLLLLGALPGADAEARLLCARTLGHGRGRGFLVAVWPGLYPQVRLGVWAVLVYAASNLDMALVLGPTAPPPLAVLALRAARDPDLAGRAVAAAASLLQLAVVVGLALGWWLGERVGALALRRVALAGPAAPTRQEAGLKAVGLTVTGQAIGQSIGQVAAWLPVGVGLTALLGLLVWSVAGPWPFPAAWPATLTGRTWAEAGPSLGAPLAATLGLGALSSTLATALAVLCLEREARSGRRPGPAWLAVLAAPLLVPGLSFLFGLSVLLIATGLDGSAVAVLGGHFLMVMPYAYLSLAGPWRAFDRRLALVAATLGAGPARVLLGVRLPVLLPSLAATLALGVAVSAAQYLPTLLLSAGRLPTLTTETLALASGGDRRVIGATAALQALVPLGAFALGLAVPGLWRARFGRQGFGWFGVRRPRIVR